MRLPVTLIPDMTPDSLGGNMSPSNKLITMAVVTAAAIALPLSTACSAIAASATAAGGAHGHSGAGAGIDQGGPASGKTGSSGAGPAGPAAPSGPAVKSGLAGPTITLDNASYSGFDAGTDKSGRTYIGWISDRANGKLRQVHLCVLPPGARGCAGGVKTVAGPISATANGLTVLVTPGGLATLVWDHTTDASESGPQGDEIATATAQGTGPLSAATDVATAPSFGAMLDATFGPNGSIWVMTEQGSDKVIQVREGLSGTFVNLKTPWPIGGGRIRFGGSTGVITIQKGGAISENIAFTTVRNGTFAKFRKQPRTWTSDSNIGLTNSASGIRMVVSEPNASYHPESWSWTGSGFGRPTLTGDFNNCNPTSHDLVSDASGRVADVSTECGDLAIVNMADTRHSGVARFSIHGHTFAGGTPQITTTPRGKGWVVWGEESSVADKLFAAPVVLPGQTVTASKTARGNHLTLHGPASCLPAVDIAVGVTAKPASNWHVVGKALHLGNSVLHPATLHGGALTAGKTYTLSGTVKFASGGSHATVTAKLKFRSCPK